MGVLTAVVLFFRAMLVVRSHSAMENLALRQQLSVYKQSVKRPKLRTRDRIFWVWLSRLWSNWRSALCMVQPETVIRWHRQASNCIGVGSPAAERRDDRQFHKTSVS